ncbi:30S ribosomal protein S17 [Candidatus Omnitrophota bacterium]
MKGAKPSRKTIVGTVVSGKMDKTVTVEWKTRKRHPLYKKFVTRHAKIKAHDGKNESSVGDLVKIAETRPISKTKSWVVVEVMEKAQKG